MEVHRIGARPPILRDLPPSLPQTLDKGTRRYRKATRRRPPPPASPPARAVTTLRAPSSFPGEITLQLGLRIAASPCLLAGVKLVPSSAPPRPHHSPSKTPNGVLSPPPPATTAAYDPASALCFVVAAVAVHFSQ
ncbi:unnamed protein product [Trichogramma brassicae]|uniref:Uncharacterized protein n=1 Tax=Trichogramma brassicae TaxID=86971 RepID=A0A6H5IJY3_9HYME|nr:unnamed protein product [Trichogramma brassicae]